MEEGKGKKRKEKGRRKESKKERKNLERKEERKKDYGLARARENWCRDSENLVGGGGGVCKILPKYT